MSPRRDPTRRAPRGWPRSTVLVVAHAPRWPSDPPSPGSPCSMLCSRLVIAKNSRIAVQHQPSVLDPRPLAVGEQGLQHLGHPTTVSGGVHVPHHPVPEGRPGPLGRGNESLRPIGREDHGELLEIDGPDVDLLHESHGAVFARAAPPRATPAGRSDARFSHVIPGLWSLVAPWPGGIESVRVLRRGASDMHEVRLRRAAAAGAQPTGSSSSTPALCRPAKYVASRGPRAAPHGPRPDGPGRQSGSRCARPFARQQPQPAGLQARPTPTGTRRRTKALAPSGSGTFAPGRHAAGLPHAEDQPAPDPASGEAHARTRLPRPRSSDWEEVPDPAIVDDTDAIVRHRRGHDLRHRPAHPQGRRARGRPPGRCSATRRSARSRRSAPRVADVAPG